MALTVSEDDVVRAGHVSGWNMSLLGRPKVTVLCGFPGCGSTFKTRDYYPLSGGPYNRSLIARCPDCRKWNALGLRYV